jgi:microcystin-dependent protein
VLHQGEGVTITGAGTTNNPYVISGSTGDSGGGTGAPTGTIWAYAGTAAPAGWLLCDGSAVATANYPTLSALIGHVYDAGVPPPAGYFRLPDLAGRMPFGSDSAHPLGSQAGAETVTLVAANLPLHNHTIAHTHPINHDHPNIGSSGTHDHAIKSAGLGAQEVGDVTGSVSKGSDVGANTTGPIQGAGGHTHNVPSYTGNSQAVNGSGVSGNGPGLAQPYTNLPPYQTVNFIIRT